MANRWDIQRKVDDFTQQCEKEGQEWQRARRVGRLPPTRNVHTAGAVGAAARRLGALRGGLDSSRDPPVVVGATPYPRPYSPLGKIDHSRHETGYQKLDDSIRRVLGVCPQGMELDDKLTHIGGWIDRYTNDTDATAAARLFGAVFARAKEETAGKPVPNTLRTAVACMLLEQMLHILARCQPPLRPLSKAIRDEVFASVYIAPPWPVGLRGAGDDGFFELRADDTEQQEELIDRFLCKSYFNALRDLAERHKHHRVEFERCDRIKAKQMRVLNRAIGFWQGRVQQKLLKAWRGVLLQQRKDAERQAEIDKLCGHLAEAERDKTRFRADAARQREEREASETELRKQLAAAKEQLKEQEQHGYALQAELRQQQRAVDELRDRCADQEARLRDLRAELDEQDEVRRALQQRSDLAAEQDAELQELRQQQADAEEQLRQYASIASEMLRAPSVAAETARRGELRDWASAQAHAPPSDSPGPLLAGWVNEMARPGWAAWAGPDGAAAAVPDSFICEPGEYLRVMLVVLRRAAPRSLSDGELRELLRCGDDVRMAREVVERLRRLRVDCAASVADLCASAPLTGDARAAVCLAAALFTRFADSRAASAAGSPPLLPADDDGGDAPPPSGLSRGVDARCSPSELWDRWREHSADEQLWVPLAARVRVAVFAELLRAGGGAAGGIAIIREAMPKSPRRPSADEPRRSITSPH